MISTNSCNWVELRIGDIAEIVAGGTPKANNPENFKEAGTGIAWLTPADLSDYSEKYISFGARDLSQQGYESSSAKILPKGSLLFSSRAPIGYVAIAKNEISTNQGFKSFVFRYGVDSDYAYYYLRSIKNVAESMGSGTTFKEISGATAKMLPFLLPSLAEQKIIADKLDILLKQVENIKSRLEHIPEIIKRFRQSVLSVAVSGNLTKGWRKDKEIVWQSLVLDDIGEVKGGKRLPKGDELVEVNTGFPYIRAGQLKQGTVINTDDARSKQLFLTPETQRKISRYTVNSGDLYITIVGASIGDAGVIPEHYSGANLTENAAKITEFKKPLKSEFLSYWLRSPQLQDMIRLEIKSGAQGKLALQRIKKLPVPYTDISEQAEIIRRVEELFAFADRIEQKANAALVRVSNLTQSILIKAFTGELTADWRAVNPELISGDNSAEVLLKKIKANREALERQPKPKRSAIKEKTDNRMSKQIIKVAETLKQAGKPLSGQQLLAAAGYPSDSNTEQLEQFFLDIRNALAIEKSIVKLERDNDSQDWFALAKDSQ
ncbi:restriction endonuclease subunit S [Acinetobacter sp. AYS6]|uniref:restriction endonuclease subunit S n=1 Tax=Acinetobacter sp. AYS6 TaxID=2983297 RepID=UPI0021D65A68|nr:restriction endonuclease subunit S [Acinetobacter sp. AYS6]MCU7698020.1 restriction endonuclease subunit S [Acinetobacter sp. AYS6]